MTTPAPEPLAVRAKALGLLSLLEDWPRYRDQPWLAPLLEREEQIRAERSLARRIQRCRIGSFKPMADFDYAWPRKIDRDQVEELFALDWLDSAANVVLLGPNGVGKTMIAQNLAYQAVLRGATVRFLTASELLNDLAAQETSHAFQRRVAGYARPRLLVIDELGYLSYDHRHADLLYEVVSRRYLKKPTLLTTNKPFAEWSEVFPSATSVVTLVDRLVHRCEVVAIDADSYRLREAKERTERKARERAARRTAAAKATTGKRT
ncbi:MAG: IS21-like element helper ATPase IstB [Solirubrobacterales bacterium]|nr:IS21-like element helper ATPase IstB [Solirubrobacterales bacterium]